MQFTYYGHSCFSVAINGKNILFDPFITPNELAAHINLKNIPADYILFPMAMQTIWPIVLPLPENRRQGSH